MGANKQMNHKLRTTGMTILELLLSVAIILILSTATVGYFRGQIVEVSLESTVKTFVSDLNLAKMRAMTGDRGMDWGIRVISGYDDKSGMWELFATSSVNLSVEPFVNEVNVLSSGLSWADPITGTKEVVFKVLTGEVSAQQFILGFGNNKYQILVSADGEISSKRI